MDMANAHGYTASIMAVRNCNIGVVGALLTTGANSDRANIYGNITSMMATNQEYTKMVQLLPPEKE